MRTFSIVVPSAVEAEIQATDARYPQRLYPDTALFDQVREQFQSPPDPEPDPLDRFGAGEAAGIALSRSMGATLLIDDRRPAEFARNLGLAVVSCPGMIVVATSQQLISAHTAQAMLRMCAARHRTFHHPRSVALIGRTPDHLRRRPTTLWHRTDPSGAGDGLRTRYLNLGNKDLRNRIQTRLSGPSCALYSRLFALP